MITTDTSPDDTTLAALISSKICHDLAGQIGAINNGLELLEDESDEDTRHYALELIHNSAKLAWAQLDFHRLAFGASSSLGDVVPLGQVEQVARRYVENGKRRLHWQPGPAEIDKDYAKLHLALLAVALTALPAGGDFYVGFSGAQSSGTSASVKSSKTKTGGKQGLKLLILCRGRIARVPERVAEIFAGADLSGIDGRFILPYYASRLAAECGLILSVAKDGEDVVFTAQTRRVT